jgi:hypothetical protein
MRAASPFRFQSAARAIGRRGVKPKAEFLADVDVHGRPLNVDGSQRLAD